MDCLTVWRCDHPCHIATASQPYQRKAYQIFFTGTNYYLDNWDGDLPAIYALYISFLHKGAGITTSFAGFYNYARVFKDYKFWASVRFTAKFVAVAVTVEMGLGLLLALLVNRDIKAQKFFRLIFLLTLLPHRSPWDF